jgi:hypothetical protein
MNVHLFLYVLWPQKPHPKLLHHQQEIIVSPEPIIHHISDNELAHPQQSAMIHYSSSNNESQYSPL